MKTNVQITLTLEYDPAENNGMPVNNFLYHFINRLNNRVPVLAVDYKGKCFDCTKKPINELPLRAMDTVDPDDLPKPPDMSKVTKLPERK